MVEAVYIINRNSGIPLYHKSFSNQPVEEGLMSGWISAISNFGNDIKIGNIKSFDTDSNRVTIVTSDDKLLAVLYDPTKEANLDSHSFAGLLIDEFDKAFPQLKGSSVPPELQTTVFDDTLDSFIKAKKKPFYYQTIEWAKKEFGGDLFIRQKQYTKDETPFVVDIVLDRGEMKNSGLIDKLTNKIVGEDFSKDVIYIKVVDGQVGSGEAKEFLEACRTFGRRRSKEDTPSYFPTVAVIIAKDYSPTFSRILENYNKKDGKYILTPEAAPRIAKMINKPPKTHRCYIQCWKWDGDYPDIIYE